VIATFPSNRTFLVARKLASAARICTPRAHVAHAVLERSR
jgi:hypothetical protein